MLLTVDRVVLIQVQILNKNLLSPNIRVKKISSLKINPTHKIYILKANKTVKTLHDQDIKTFLIHVHKNQTNNNIHQKNITITLKKQNLKTNFINHKKYKNKKSLISKVSTCINKMKIIYKMFMIIVSKNIIKFPLLQLIVI